MSGPAMNRVVADFRCDATGDKTIRLKDLRGQNVVLYFYPKDSTPGCTTEGQDFAANHAKFKRRKTVVLGVSRDSITSHEKFRAKYNFPFDLLSDEDLSVSVAYGAAKDQDAGKASRISYLIGADGKIVKAYAKVKAADHPEEVLSDLD